MSRLQTLKQRGELTILVNETALVNIGIALPRILIQLQNATDSEGPATVKLIREV